MNALFTEPNKDLAQKILSEVDSEERLVGFKMNPRAGNKPFSLYSLEEVVNFLQVDSMGELLTKGSRASIGYVDFQALQGWVSEVMGDKELAKAIGEEVERKDNYWHQVKVIKSLLEDRLNQCRTTMDV